MATVVTVDVAVIVVVVEEKSGGGGGGGLHGFENKSKLF